MIKFIPPKSVKIIHIDGKFFSYDVIGIDSEFEKEII